MSNETESRAYEPERQSRWRTEVVLPSRSPRTGEEKVLELVRRAWPPTVVMRENPQTTDIVIRFNCSSRELSPVHKRAYFEGFMPLKRVFDVAISKPATKSESTLRSRLSTEAFRAYRMAWLHLFRCLYVDQFDPKINSRRWIARLEKELMDTHAAGRPKRVGDEQLGKRLNALTKRCEGLHRNVIKLQKTEQHESQTSRVRVLRALWKLVLRMPQGVSVLGGEAFQEIPYGKRDRPGTLEDPTSWKPRQLAIALLALDEGREYQTIERRFPHHERTGQPGRGRK